MFNLIFLWWARARPQAPSPSRTGGYSQTETQKNQIEKIKRNHINLKFYTRILHKSASNDRPKLVGVYSKKGRDNFANQIVKQYLDSVESWLLLLEKLE